MMKYFNLRYGLYTEYIFDLLYNVNLTFLWNPFKYINYDFTKEHEKYPCRLKIIDENAFILLNAGGRLIFLLPILAVVTLVLYFLYKFIQN